MYNYVFFKVWSTATCVKTPSVFLKCIPLAPHQTYRSTISHKLFFFFVNQRLKVARLNNELTQSLNIIYENE